MVWKFFSKRARTFPRIMYPGLNADPPVTPGARYGEGHAVSATFKVKPKRANIQSLPDVINILLLALSIKLQKRKSH